MTRYLVTGGAGFIGSHLVDALLLQGHRVVVLDDFSSGRLRNIERWIGCERFECVVGSVLDERLVQTLVADAEVVFHLAAVVGVCAVTRRLLHTLTVNTQGTANVLSAASPQTTVVVASSSEVYGDAHEMPLAEGLALGIGATGKGRWGYACAKALDEFTALAHHKERQIPTVVVRLFNVSGPRQTGRYGMVLPRFVTQALGGQPLMVHGDGHQSRCFAHVHDCVAALLALSCQPQAYGHVVNVGTQQEVSIEGLARQVLALTQSASKVVYQPYDEAYPGGEFAPIQRRVPDLRRLRSLIGERQERSLREIILDVVQDQETFREGEPCLS